MIVSSFSPKSKHRFHLSVQEKKKLLRERERERESELRKIGDRVYVD